MRSLLGSLLIGFVLCAQVAVGAESSIEDATYPGAVALGQSPTGGWLYRSFPELLPLYTFDGEPTGRSLCDRDCTAVWPIIQARANDEPIGSWTIVKREDGRLQWAYRGSPVYTYFEDRPNEPKGEGKSMDWYLDEAADAYLESVGVVADESASKSKNKKARQIKATAQLLQP